MKREVPDYDLSNVKGEIDSKDFPRLVGKLTVPANIYAQVLCVVCSYQRKKNVLCLRLLLLTNADFFFYARIFAFFFFYFHNTFALSFLNGKGVKYDSFSKVVSDNPSHKTLV